MNDRQGTNEALCVAADGDVSVSSAAACPLAEAVVALELSHSVKATKCCLTTSVQAVFQQSAV